MQTMLLIVFIESFISADVWHELQFKTRHYSSKQLLQREESRFTASQTYLSGWFEVVPGQVRNKTALEDTFGTP